MKKLFIFFLYIIILFSLPAKQLELKKIYVDGTEEILMLDENIDIIVLYSSDAKPKEIKDIVGLNQYKNLKTLDIPMLRYDGDWNFLNGLASIKNLGICSNSKNLKSLKFLETLTNLETLDCDFIINEEYKDSFLNEKIDLSGLKKLDKIYYHSRFLKKDFTGCYFTGRIPNFVNVKNKPKLYLDNNGIEFLTYREKRLLKQYSEVNFYSNPIAKKKIK